MPRPDTIVVAASSGASWLYASFDGGGTWSTVLADTDTDTGTDTGTGGALWTDLDFPEGSAGVVLLGGYGNPGATVYRSADGADRWVPLALG